MTVSSIKVVEHTGRGPERGDHGQVLCMKDTMGTNRGTCMGPRRSRWQEEACGNVLNYTDEEAACLQEVHMEYEGTRHSASSW